MLFYLQGAGTSKAALATMSSGRLNPRKVTTPRSPSIQVWSSCIYKVAGQRRVIAIVDLPDAESLDRTIMGGLPMAQYLEFEAIWPLRDYAPFIEDCKEAFKAGRPG